MTERATYTVTLLERPWTTNAERASNRWVRAELVKKWRTAFKLLALSQQIPTLQNVHITAQPYQKGGTLADVASCNPAVKAAIDGLVDAGVMEDDSPEFLHSITFLQPQRGKNALTLTITGEERTKE